MARVLSLGVAAALHVVAYAALPGRAPRSEPRLVPVEVASVAPAPAPVPAPAPPRAAPAPAPPRAGPSRGHRAARPRPVVAVAAAVAPAPAAEAVTVPAPAGEGTGEDDAVALEGAVRGAAREAGGGTGGGAEAAPAPPAGPSRRAPAEPTEDYTRLVPPYSDDAIDHDVTGAVALRLEIDEQGRVTRATVLKGRGYGLDEVAVATAKRYRFHPATDDAGRPTRSVIGWRIVWESYWKRLFVETVAGHPNCRGDGPMNLGEYHPVYMDCDAPPGFFALTPEELRGRP